MNVVSPKEHTHDIQFRCDIEAAERVRRGLDDGSIALNAKQDEVSSALIMSTRILNRRLHSEGTSLKTIITQTRLEKSRALLAITTLSVEVIAKMLGLSGGRTLAQIFIRKTGESPSQYQNSFTVQY